MEDITVIMGVYNMEIKKEQLYLSIESIKRQTFTNWKFIICDDGSTDETLEILKEKYGNNERIEIISLKKNQGLRSALNECLKNVKSKYIVRQDADDYSRDDRLELLYKSMQSDEEIDVLGTGMILFDENGEYGIRKPRKKNPNKKDFLKGTVISHATCIIKTDVLKNVNGYRVAWETTRCEDYDLFMRIMANGFKIKNIDDELYFVREDLESFYRKKYINRIKEAVFRYKGYKALHLPLYSYLYILKPIIIGLIPNTLLRVIKRI
ncbi:glycosyltransferase [Cetobacterium sp.]|uniref:glycosyltransferase n=1 Tax=Cetobacterium sp. TaxID=2071632 RepID=UPI003EE76C1C